MILDTTHAARFTPHRNETAFHFMGDLLEFPILYLI